MSKELEALKRIKSHYNDRVCIDILEDFDLIENALKRLAVYETFGLLDEKYDDVDKLTDIKGKLTYVDRVMDTQERLLASVSSDEIRILNSVLNSQIRKLKKKLTVLMVIKKISKSTNHFRLIQRHNFGEDEITYYFVIDNCEYRLRNKEEFESFKEVIGCKN